MTNTPLDSTSRESILHEERSRLLRYSANINDYTYTSLPTEYKRIRLLRLVPGALEDRLIMCEMIEAEFLENDLSDKESSSESRWGRGLPYIVREGTRTDVAIEYEALSWRWGDEKNTGFAITIRKNGITYQKKVSETLGLALKYLRGPADRILWIDAICIDQTDTDERSNQVSMMSLVYTRAKQVCIWLGDDDKDSRAAIRFIKDDISHLKGFDRLCTNPENAPKWRAFLHLMQREWFSRRWVVQEIALAPDATVYCGLDSIKWRELAIAVELFVEVETATHRLSELLRKDDKSHLVPNWFEHISELGASLLVNATARIFRNDQRSNTSDAQMGYEEAPQGLLSLEYLVTTLSIFDCGRPHDSVYALIAIARDASPNPPTSITQRKKGGFIAEAFADQLERKPYPLDYTSPYPDVCQEFIHFCIQRSAKIDPLQALDILCRPWAKDWQPGTLLGIEEEVLPKPCRSTILAANDDEDTQILASQSHPQKRIARKIQLAFPRSGRGNERPVLVNALSNSDHIREKRRKKGKNSEKKTIKDDPTYEEILAEQTRELGLPSWVAKINGAPFDIFPHPGMDMVKMGRKNADPLVGSPQDGHRNYNAGQSKGIDLKVLRFRKRPRLGHYSLYVKGFCFDRVHKVAQISQAGAIPASWLKLANWINAQDLTKPIETIDDPPEAFWRTLVADRGRNDRNPPYYYARACKETIAKGGIRSNAVDTTALIFNERNSIIAEFCRRVQAVIWNRALIKTERGSLGLVSEDVRKGDLICIIYGCTVPVILRQGNTQYKTANERENEKMEDGVEAWKRLITRIRRNLSRKAAYQKDKTVDKAWIKERTDEFNTKHGGVAKDHGPEDLTPENIRIEREKLQGNEDDLSEDDSEDDSDDDLEDENSETVCESPKYARLATITDNQKSHEDNITPTLANNIAQGSESEATEHELDTKKNLSEQAKRQNKASERDALRYFNFLGEAYIHGMMDGEAVRLKFRHDKPDHVFEIR